MKVVGIIQARMGSCRLPGKVTRELEGRPMILHLIDRLKRCRYLDEIILATGNGEENTPLYKLGKEAGIQVFRGSEEDVLSRFYLAAQNVGAQHIVRVTGDNPLTDPKCIDLMIKRQLEIDADYGYVTGLPVGAAAEIISYSALATSYKEGHHQPHREHVTIYVKENPEKFKLFYIEAPKEVAASEFRLTVDTKEDFVVMSEIYSALYKEGNIVNLADVIKLLRNNPKLANLNSGIQQKKPRDRRVIIRVDGGVERGMGHIYRTISLANALVAQKPVEVVFVTTDEKEAINKIKEAGYEYITLPKKGYEDEELELLSKVINEQKTDAVVIDILDTSEKYISTLKKLDLKVICLDNTKIKENLPDLKINALAEKEMQYMVLSDKLSERARDRRPLSHEVKNILITMGGSDPAGLTMKVLRSLLLIDMSLKLRVILGPAFPWKIEIDNLLAEQNSKVLVDIVYNTPDMSSLMWEADIAICSAGLTMFELAALGVPSIVLSQHEEQNKNAEYMEYHGAIINLGIGRDVSEQQILADFYKLLNSYEDRTKISRRARQLVDGQGTERIVNEMIRLLYG